MTGPVLLGPAQYDSVRQAVEIGLNAADLPDSVIAQDQYAGAAERQVLQLVGSLSTSGPVNVDAWRGTDAWRQLETGAVLLCASFIVGNIPHLTSETFAAYRYSRVPQDPILAAQSLRSRAVAAIAAAVQVDLLNAARPRAMILGPGGRGDISPLHPGRGVSFLGPF